jgi:hypothetical protein
MVLKDMSWREVEEYQRPWVRNAGIWDGKQFRSINLTFYEISEKGVRCNSKIACFDFEIVLYDTEIVPFDFKIVHYDPENTVSKPRSRVGHLRTTLIHPEPN